MGNCWNSNGWYACMVPLQQIIGCLCQLGITKILGPVLLSLAHVLILGIIYLFYLFFLPLIAKDSQFLYVTHFLIGLFLSINIFYNLFSCAFTSPGTPKRCIDPVAILGSRMRIINGKESPQLLKEVILTPGVSYKFCRHCRCIKPPRAHHDSVSGKCVFEMDHYCPWMNNCVGYYNYRYFVLFLSYLFLGCCYIVIVTNSQVLKLNAIERNQLVHGAVTLEDIVLLTWTVGFSASLAVGILLGWHIFLIVTNQTTIEFYINYENRNEARAHGFLYRNPFDQGYRKNIRRFLGQGSWPSILYPSPYLPYEPLYPLQLSPGVLKCEEFIV